MLLYIISALIIIGIAVYVIMLYKGKIKDEDKDFIPDAVEDAVEEFADEIEDKIIRYKNIAKNITRKKPGRKFKK
jgi:predicted PurR-regulated permease PerM